MEIFGDLIDWSLQPLAEPDWVVCRRLGAQYPMPQSWVRQATLSQSHCPDHRMYFCTEILSNRNYLCHTAVIVICFLLWMETRTPAAVNDTGITAGLSKNVLFREKERKERN